MKPAVFHREAKEEFDAAIVWYDAKSAGLGSQLLDEVEQAIRKLKSDPCFGARYRSTKYRFCRLRHFPYLLYYLDLPDKVWIAAVAHSRRRPNYWRMRKPE